MYSVDVGKLKGLREEMGPVASGCLAVKAGDSLHLP